METRPRRSVILPWMHTISLDIIIVSLCVCTVREYGYGGGKQELVTGIQDTTRGNLFA